MNILFIYDAPLRPEAGGTERATKLVIDELSRRNYRCLGILHYSQENPCVHFYNSQKIDSLSSFLYENNIDVVVNQIAFHPRFLSQFYLYGGREWREKGGKIVSFMHLDPTPVPPKRITDYFDDWKSKGIIGKVKRIGLILISPLVNKKTLRDYRNGLRYLYDNSDAYVVMSKSYIDVFRKLSGVKDLSKIHVIPNMLTFPEIASPEILRKKENIVLVVARMDDEQKNISFIIDVWKKIADHKGYQLHVLGDGRDKEKLERRAKDVKDIYFEGSQSPLKWYLRSKIFLMASPREGWGLTITESMQNGVVPIILNTSMVFKDIVSHGVDGFLPVTKEEYSHYIECLMSDDKLREKLANNALLSSIRFCSQSVGELWEEMLNGLKIKENDILDFKKY